MVHSNTKNSKSRVRQSQVCYLHTTHSSALNDTYIILYAGMFPPYKDLDSFMRGSGDKGVILFSFGSYMRGMKKDQAETLLAAFSRLKQRVVMKYKDEESLTPPKNTLVLKWLPQNDILGKSAWFMKYFVFCFFAFVSVFARFKRSQLGAIYP